MASTPPVSTQHLPRLLCLHGGGVTAEIFRLQSRALISALTPYFRLVFADGPFFCAAGPGMIPVYANHGPYRRWLRWLPEHPPVDHEDAITEIEYQMRLAMDADDRDGGTGPWVGLVGFSQGAKLASSVLYETQLRREEARANGGDGMYGGFEEENIAGLAGGSWQFAILMAGRAPLVNLSPRAMGSKTMVKPGDVSEGFAFDQDVNRNVLALPTLHVHGTKDPGLHLHRKLLDTYCDKKSATVVEWEGEHRIPLKSMDVKRVVEGILQVALKAGVLRQSQINGTH